MTPHTHQHRRQTRCRPSSRVTGPGYRLWRAVALARPTALLAHFAGYRLREMATYLDHTADELQATLRTAITILAQDPRTSRPH